MGQESCNTLLLAGKSSHPLDANDLVSVRLSSSQIKQIYLALNIFQLQYGSQSFTKKMQDIDGGILDTLDYHTFDLAALKLDAKSYVDYTFSEIKLQLDQGIITAEKKERCYAS